MTMADRLAAINRGWVAAREALLGQVGAAGAKHHAFPFEPLAIALDLDLQPMYVLQCT